MPDTFEMPFFVRSKLMPSDQRTSSHSGTRASMTSASSSVMIGIII